MRVCCCWWWGVVVFIGGGGQGADVGVVVIGVVADVVGGGGDVGRGSDGGVGAGDLCLCLYLCVFRYICVCTCICDTVREQWCNHVMTIELLHFGYMSIQGDKVWQHYSVADSACEGEESIGVKVTLRESTSCNWSKQRDFCETWLSMAVCQLLLQLVLLPFASSNVCGKKSH